MKGFGGVEGRGGRSGGEGGRSGGGWRSGQGVVGGVEVREEWMSEGGAPPWWLEWWEQWRGGRSGGVGGVEVCEDRVKTPWRHTTYG